MHSYTHQHKTILCLLAVTLCAFVLRALMFYSYIQHEERYNQPDSPGYHMAGLCIAYGHGMHRPDTHQPIFWRTPGYPAYLSFFFKKFPPHDSSFSGSRTAHSAAIWMQIFLTSFIPVILFFLALTLTNSATISWIVALISALHLGFILASTFLLTDALAQLFFVLFLLCYFKSFWRHAAKPLMLITLAALTLSIYTWMRPMGQFVALGALILLLFSHDTWWNTVKKMALFLFVFGATVAPWFIRNHALTGYWTFCPLFGLYFNVFSAPKILARVESCTLEAAHKTLTQDAGALTYQELLAYKKNKSPYVVCGEIICLKTALPLLLAHPFYFIYDWCTEIIKTTFDLYAGQLVALANNCFKWDPLVEFLPEKIKECLYKKPLPAAMRLYAWFELLASLILWLGIIGGFCWFTLASLFQRTTTVRAQYSTLWVHCLFMVACVVGQTGGFGYARLRLPIEPLLLILGVTFWYYMYTQYKNTRYTKRL